jgi:hypothetical protein
MSGYNIRNLPPAKRLRFAVQAAVTAFEKSGRMLDAALTYAEHGVPIFPLDPRSKKPIPRRDRDRPENIRKASPEPAASTR